MTTINRWVVIDFAGLCHLGSNSQILCGGDVKNEPKP